MNTPLLVLLTAAAATATDGTSPSLYRPTPVLAAALEGSATPAVIRGQSPYGSEPLYTPGVQGNTTTLYPPTYAPDGTQYPAYDPAITTDPYGNATPYYPGTSDPWAQPQPGTPMPYAPAPYYGQQPAPMNVPQGFYTYGMNGPQPYRYGLQERVNIGWLPDSGTSPNRGDFSIFEFDFEKSWVTPVWNNWVFTASPQFNARLWDGPSGTIGPANLPADVYRFGMAFQLATPQVNGWSAEFGFNPSFAHDFEADVDSDAFFFDGHAVAFWQWNPQWTWALGFLYWDRVDDIFLPYAGLVYTPNDYWEFRLVFPNPRISYFLGTPYGVATWVYVGAEYHVEAYYIDLHFAGVDTRVQYEDWRVYGGMRFEAGQYVTFFELGAAVAREVDFDRVGADFDVDSGFFGRVGLRW